MLWEGRWYCGGEWEEVVALFLCSTHRVATQAQSVIKNASLALLQVFTVTVPQTQEAAADELVRQLAPGARLTYALAGTRKYELPADQVSLSGG